MKIKLVAGVLALPVLLFLIYKLGYHLYPIQAVIIENRVLHFLGMVEKIEIPKTGLSNGSSISFPTIEKFEMLGMDGEHKAFVLRSDKFEFKDLKIWKFYTPLMKFGYLTKPQFFFYSKKRGEIKCVAREGKLLDQNQRLVFDKDSMCWFDNKMHRISKLEYDHKLKLLKLEIMGLKTISIK